MLLDNHPAARLSHVDNKGAIKCEVTSKKLSLGFLCLGHTKGTAIRAPGLTKLGHFTAPGCFTAFKWPRSFDLRCLCDDYTAHYNTMPFNQVWAREILF